jgi:hypothetical protein
MALALLLLIPTCQASPVLFEYSRDFQFAAYATIDVHQYEVRFGQHSLARMWRHISGPWTLELFKCIHNCIEKCIEHNGYQSLQNYSIREAWTDTAYFSNSLAWSRDTTRIAIGQPNENKVTILERDSLGLYQLIDTLYPPIYSNLSIDFGARVNFCNGTSVLVVSAPSDKKGRGSVYIFTRGPEGWYRLSWTLEPEGKANYFGSNLLALPNCLAIFVNEWSASSFYVSEPDPRDMAVWSNGGDQATYWFELYPPHSWRQTLRVPSRPTIDESLFLSHLKQEDVHRFSFYNKGDPKL